MDDFERVGGRLCLDFINTRGSHFDEGAREYVGDYAGLVAWLRACDGGLDARQASRLLAEARDHPRKAAEAFAKSRELRALLYRVIAARALAEEALLVLNEIGDRWFMALGLELYAAVAVAEQRAEPAARLFGAAEALRESIACPLPEARRASYERQLAAARSLLKAPRFAQAWTEGRLMTVPQALGARICQNMEWLM